MSLLKASHDPLLRAQSLAAMSEADLRREAVRAASARDVEALWALTEAHLTLHGDAGALVSASTYRTYRRGVKDLLAAWQGENLLRPSRDAAALWLRKLEASGRKPATVRVKIAAAKALYKALRWAKATDAAPFADARAARDKTAPWEKQSAYRLSDLERMLAHADAYTRVLILLGAHGGLRIAEILALRWEDIDLYHRKLTVVRGKGGKRRSVNLSKTLVGALELLPNNEGLVLPFRSRPSARERLERVCRKTGVKFLGLHALRHAAGTRLQRQTGDLTKVADHLGHATLDMARNYAKADDEALKRALEDW
jgi:integrase